MKNLIYLLFALTFSCTACKKNSVPITDKLYVPEKQVVISDCASLRDSVLMFRQKDDITRGAIKILDLESSKKDSIIDSLKTANNKLAKELLHNKLIIQNAKYYLEIVNRRPSQQKFLRGWMNRALNQ